MNVSEATILAVDDDTNLRNLVGRTLELAGYRVLKAASGREALELIDRNKVNLVLLDILMPEMDGFETLKLIREKSEVPVIMVTAIGEIGALTNSMELGADDYVQKPFETRQLLARIQAKLRRARK